MKEKFPATILLLATVGRTQPPPNGTKSRRQIGIPITSYSGVAARLLCQVPNITRKPNPTTDTNIKGNGWLHPKRKKTSDTELTTESETAIRLLGEMIPDPIFSPEHLTQS